mmetsp:Transcript_104661/g.145934  ORF Transcript_104661/g.145934 Transcript_104661/m.145934 type:complete len:122 (-) Transcript_104661:242-607(-)|eukprot:symbB.v1.2.040943.t1/scaffold7283.1/size13980/2
MAEKITIYREDILMEGFVVKQSKHLKEWRQRWCILTPQYFCSFKTQGETCNPTEFVRLADCSSICSAEDFTGKENSFCLKSADRSIILIAHSAAEKEQWISRVGKQLVIGRSSVLIDDDYD